MSWIEVGRFETVSSNRYDELVSELENASHHLQEVDPIDYFDLVMNLGALSLDSEKSTTDYTKTLKTVKESEEIVTVYEDGVNLGTKDGMENVFGDTKTIYEIIAANIHPYINRYRLDFYPSIKKPKPTTRIKNNNELKNIAEANLPESIKALAYIEFFKADTAKAIKGKADHSLSNFKISTTIMPALKQIYLGGSNHTNSVSNGFACQAGFYETLTSNAQQVYMNEYGEQASIYADLIKIIIGLNSENQTKLSLPDLKKQKVSILSDIASGNLNLASEKLNELYEKSIGLFDNVDIKSLYKVSILTAS